MLSLILLYLLHRPSEVIAEIFVVSLVVGSTERKHSLIIFILLKVPKTRVPEEKSIWAYYVVYIYQLIGTRFCDSWFAQIVTQLWLLPVSVSCTFLILMWNCTKWSIASPTWSIFPCFNSSRAWFREGKKNIVSNFLNRCSNWLMRKLDNRLKIVQTCVYFSSKVYTETLFKIELRMFVLLNIIS